MTSVLTLEFAKSRNKGPSVGILTLGLTGRGLPKAQQQVDWTMHNAGQTDRFCLQRPQGDPPWGPARTYKTLASTDETPQTSWG